MDRRRTALALLMGFILCIGVAVVVSGSRPHLQQGLAPTVVQFTGYLLALVAAVLLLREPAEAPDGVRLIGELVILVATVRLALGVARAGRTR